MLRSLHTAATGMKAQQSTMDVIANNMANSNTTAFKKSRAEFEDLMYITEKEPGAQTGENSVSPTGVQIGLGVKTSAVNKDFLQGSSKQTNNALDLEIQGNGFFPVQTPNGQIAYTRDGAFKQGPDGQMQDKNGNRLQPEINIPSEAVKIEIAPNGQVSYITDQNRVPQNVGQIELVSFVNPAGLRNIGRNLFSPSNSSGTPQQGNPGQAGLGTLGQGFLETSNVSIVDEMVGMIAAQRAYETNSKMIQTSDQMLQQLNNLR